MVVELKWTLTSAALEDMVYIFSSITATKMDVRWKTSIDPRTELDDDQTLALVVVR